MAKSLSKIHIRMNAFALPGRTTQHIHTIPRVSLCLPWAMRSLGFQPARFAPLTVSSACPLRLPWAMCLLGLQPTLPKSETLGFDHYRCKKGERHPSALPNSPWQRCRREGDRRGSLQLQCCFLQRYGSTSRIFAADMKM